MNRIFVAMNCERRTPKIHQREEERENFCLTYNYYKSQSDRHTVFVIVIINTFYIGIAIHIEPTILMPICKSLLVYCMQINK